MPRLIGCLLCALPLVVAQVSVVHAQGWSEVVVSVRDIDTHQRFFEEVAKWKLVKRGEVTRAQLRAWQLPSSAQAEYRLFANPGTRSGAVRLLKFKGVKQTYVRPDAQAWDTGGIFDINVRVKDLRATADEVRALGWQARAPISQFSFGPFVVKEWIARSPSGLTLAMIERVQPPLEGWPHLRSVSRAFNATMVVRDLDASVKFFKEVLGFKPYLEHRGASEKAAPNVLGLPHNIATQVERRVVILHPQGTNEGSIELLQFVGAVGSDYSRLANMPNWGVVALRFPVDGILALDRRLKKAGVSYVHQVQQFSDRQALTIRMPEGGWLEFYQADQINETKTMEQKR